MKTFIEKKFDIPELSGISKKNIEEHLKLYTGYVKHANLIQDTIRGIEESGTQTAPENIFMIAELRRRFSFEFCGMRNHEYFFSAFEGGAVACNSESTLYKKICETWGDFETWQKEFSSVALTRGIGWAMLYYDRQTEELMHAWVDEQHLGQLATCDIILALDMWEHAFVYDYPTSEKKLYVDSFFKNINWTVVESRFN